jgi:hypothetical protein
MLITICQRLSDETPKTVFQIDLLKFPKTDNVAECVDLALPSGFGNDTKISANFNYESSLISVYVHQGPFLQGRLIVSLRIKLESVVSHLGFSTSSNDWVDLIIESTQKDS